jgi:hypothetical protein
MQGHVIVALHRSHRDESRGIPPTNHTKRYPQALTLLNILSGVSGYLHRPTATAVSFSDGKTRQSFF